ncbi:hypothetical protein PRZ48_001259 [Zasmidium cellare]|uniref:N-acetyltransferase domain-containing protein n=1 Tax=Zasmidium cellare TaxID=395010 RepID=A0ABR0F1Q8_ZASCE|nr:hypothetical protein PRZ48_001259 [Zasmidium cellare]
MPVNVLPAEDADMPRIFEIAALAFARNEPIWDAQFPKHWTPEGRKVGGERMTLTKNSDPYTTYLKAVDVDSGKILGMAKWNIYQNTRPDPSKVKGWGDEWYETEAEQNYIKAMVPVFLAKRNAAIERTNGNLVSLDILSIDPAHQRKKVGDALVKWGLKRADELGLPAVVESSVFGKGLYEKNGFIFGEDVRVVVPGFEDWPVGEFAWLERPKTVNA